MQFRAINKSMQFRAMSSKKTPWVNPHIKEDTLEEAARYAQRPICDTPWLTLAIILGVVGYAISFKMGTNMARLNDDPKWYIWRTGGLK